MTIDDIKTRRASKYAGRDLVDYTLATLGDIDWLIAEVERKNVLIEVLIEQINEDDQ